MEMWCRWPITCRWRRESHSHISLRAFSAQGWELVQWFFQWWTPWVKSTLPSMMISISAAQECSIWSCSLLLVSYPPSPSWSSWPLPNSDIVQEHKFECCRSYHYSWLDPLAQAGPPQYWPHCLGIPWPAGWAVLSEVSWLLTYVVTLKSIQHNHGDPLW